MIVQESVFDGYFIKHGWQPKCRKCKYLGKIPPGSNIICFGVHGDEKDSKVKTLRFDCGDYNENGKSNQEAMIRLLCLIKRRARRRQIEGGKK